MQADLGVPLNFTGFSAVVAQEFEASGDFLKGNGLAILGQMLDRGVKISLLYGDRDYQCNCRSFSVYVTCAWLTVWYRVWRRSHQSCHQFQHLELL